MKINVLTEMAIQRKDAIKECRSLGKQFVSHFHKCVKEGTSSDDFYHHCSEMQAFWDDVRKFVLKQDGKLINSDNLINWFFTCCSDVEHIIDETYQDIYEQLYLQLLSNRNNSKVSYIMKDLLEN